GPSSAAVGISSARSALWSARSLLSLFFPPACWREGNDVDLDQLVGRRPSPPVRQQAGLERAAASLPHSKAAAPQGARKPSRGLVREGERTREPQSYAWAPARGYARPPNAAAILPPIRCPHICERC